MKSPARWRGLFGEPVRGAPAILSCDRRGNRLPPGPRVVWNQIFREYPFPALQPPTTPILSGSPAVKAGCSPAEPASALPAGIHVASAGRHSQPPLAGAGDFSTGVDRRGLSREVGCLNLRHGPEELINPGSPVFCNRTGWGGRNLPTGLRAELFFVGENARCMGSEL
jgi:hypothetical protein